MSFKPLIWLVSVLLLAYSLRQLLNRRRRQILHQHMRLIATFLLTIACAALLWLGYRRLFLP